MRRVLRLLGTVVAGILLAGILIVALVGGGLVLIPSAGYAFTEDDAVPRRPPVVPPDLPMDAPKSLVLYLYSPKIEQTWGRDWPMAIRLLEDLVARYPDDSAVHEKLYAAYVEHGRALAKRGATVEAEAVFERAIRFDPDRPEAQTYLDDLAAASGRAH
ncbi:MAG: hypothetical protein IT305_16470 [Chloroflexi bacterium]|nr:hypothetical protein [Chloroflexota bacterium]